MEREDIQRDGKNRVPRKKVKWWRNLLRHMRIVTGYDEDFGEKVKIGVKFKWKW